MGRKRNQSKQDRGLGVVLADIDAKLKLVVEGHGTLDKKIDKVEERVGDFRRDADYKFGVLMEMTAKKTQRILK